MEAEQDPFVAYLERLSGYGTAMAALRRGIGYIGQGPNTDPAVHRYIAPWVNPKSPPYTADTYYALAALFAIHPASGGKGNMGDHMRTAAHSSALSLDDRFDRLIRVSEDTLPLALKNEIAFLKTTGVRVDWNQLLADIRYWGHPDRFIQMRWARAYYGQGTDRDYDQE